MDLTIKLYFKHFHPAELCFSCATVLARVQFAHACGQNQFSGAAVTDACADALMFVQPRMELYPESIMGATVSAHTDRHAQSQTHTHTHTKLRVICGTCRARTLNLTKYIIVVKLLETKSKERGATEMTCLRRNPLHSTEDMTWTTTMRFIAAATRVSFAAMSSDLCVINIITLNVGGHSF